MEQEAIQLEAEVFSGAAVVGKKEGDGPLGTLFDRVDPTDRFGASSWEAAESAMQKEALSLTLSKGGLCDGEVGALFAGDLLNQCVGSAYGLVDFEIPYFGLYGACSTSAEGLMLASVLVTHGVTAHAAAVTSSHYCAAERQYRTPLEYGAQRAPTAQWTVTGAGAFLVRRDREEAGTGRAVITRAMPGRVKDAGIKDAANMGAAMAPAAADTLLRFFQVTGTTPEDYDLIATGDLGFEGGAILCDLMRAEGYDLGARYTDCGQLIYQKEAQDVHSGGSGCGCSAVVLASHLLPSLRHGALARILFLATGAMMSPDSLKQGNSIPAVAHLLELVRR